MLGSKVAKRRCGEKMYPRLCGEDPPSGKYNVSALIGGLKQHPIIPPHVP